MFRHKYIIACIAISLTPFDQLQMDLGMRYYSKWCCIRAGVIITRGKLGWFWTAFELKYMAGLESLWKVPSKVPFISTPASVGKQTIIILTLPNISRSIDNQKGKFHQLIEYNVRNIFFKNDAENEAGRLCRPLFVFWKRSFKKDAGTSSQHILCMVFRKNVYLVIFH